jgi:hypothetical protein
MQRLEQDFRLTHAGERRRAQTKEAPAFAGVIAESGSSFDYFTQPVEPCLGCLDALSRRVSPVVSVIHAMCNQYPILQS